MLLIEPWSLFLVGVGLLRVGSLLSEGLLFSGGSLLRGFACSHKCLIDNTFGVLFILFSLLQLSKL